MWQGTYSEKLGLGSSWKPYGSTSGPMKNLLQKPASAPKKASSWGKCGYMLIAFAVLAFIMSSLSSHAEPMTMDAHQANNDLALQTNVASVDLEATVDLEKTTTVAKKVAPADAKVAPAAAKQPGHLEKAYDEMNKYNDGEESKRKDYYRGVVKKEMGRVDTLESELDKERHVNKDLKDADSALAKENEELRRENEKMKKDLDDQKGKWEKMGRLFQTQETEGRQEE